ncbi:unnamed protein product [Cuscuta campestris]|uniref:mannan endo-1,4-beta-mannosidase n=2 Tax=Cuscuta sect. Cleistogrammica TaxID=1824901 RepID=A0A484L5B4_9ASTE|nr:hypothetical protein DM860_009785 [Cuscuta australis]VFQ71519.1 unnamed protein product [Cuscuta campestris]
MEYLRKTSHYVLVLLFTFLALGAEAARNLRDDGGWITVSGGHFELNGSPYLFNGFNSYWMMHVASDVGERNKVTEVLREASAAGLSVCRTWAFSDGNRYNALQTSPGVYDERVFQGLDFVLTEARKYGVRLILSLVNNYNDFGGKAQYTEWAKNNGTEIHSDDDFYTNPVPKEYYKNHVKRVITRVNTITGIAYMDDPTIMAWELMNEPRCATDYSGKTVNDWVEEMAGYVKSLDKKHLLEIGMEGFYGESKPERQEYNPGYSVGTDYITNHMVQDIDFATIHAYTDQWESGKSDEEQMAFMVRWISSHWQDAENILKKPLVLAEFGKSSHDPGYTLTARDTFITNVYRDAYNLAHTGGTMAGAMIWQLMAEGMEGWDDGYSIVLADYPSTARIIAGQSYVMASLSQHLFSRPRPHPFGHAYDCITHPRPILRLPHSSHRHQGRAEA